MIRKTMIIFSQKVLLYFLLVSLLPVFMASSCKDNAGNPVAPTDYGFTKVSSYKTLGTSNGVFVKTINSKTVAFVADGNSGLQIIDVTIPTVPELASNYNSDGFTYDVKVAKVNGIDYAILADGINDVLVLDVSDINNPVRKNFVEFVDDAVISLAIDTVNNKAFAGSYKGFLYIFDLNGLPNTLTVLGTYSAYDKIEGIYIEETKCYLAENNYGLEIVNIADYTFPTAVSFVDSPGQSLDVYVNSGIAYVADGNAGISLFNVFDAASPIYIKSVSTKDVSTSLFYGQQRLFTTDGFYGIEGYLISQPSSPVSFGAYKTTGVPYGGYYYNNYVYVANGNEGLLILRITVN
jgi:hypothetical protein